MTTQHRPYRGKRIDTGMWVEGFMHQIQGEGKIYDWDWSTEPRSIKETTAIFNNSWILVPVLPEDTGWQIGNTFIAHEVHPDTVGQAWDVNDIVGKCFFEDDLVRVKYKYKRNENWYTEAEYRVSKHSAHGLSLGFVRLLNDDPLNQYPLMTSLQYGSNLYQDHKNDHYDRVAIQETYSGGYDGVYYSNDLTITGSIHDIKTPNNEEVN